MTKLEKLAAIFGIIVPIVGVVVWAVRITSQHESKIDEMGRRLESRATELDRRIDATSAELGKRIDSIDKRTDPGLLEEIEKQKQAALKAIRDEAARSAFPIGAVIALPGDTIPTGWALCDGRPMESSKHRALFSAIG